MNFPPPKTTVALLDCHECGEPVELKATKINSLCASCDICGAKQFVNRERAARLVKQYYEADETPINRRKDQPVLQLEEPANDDERDEPDTGKRAGGGFRDWLNS